ncbi:MAG: Slp family lipoprotein [Chromatiales bacterium]|jgi:outer membrane lipoprotein
MRCLTLSSALLLLTLNGCATTPKVMENAERGISPTEAVSQASTTGDRPLQWGGVIVETSNLADTTELQILAYPLKSNGRPDVTASPTGRFIARHPGYLESVDYGKGRQVTATGMLSETRAGRVGEADYTFPVLSADELVLWPKQREREASPRVNFGFGVGSGGRSWGGVGIGIGF